MTTFQIVTHLLSALLPSLSVLVFLLLHRRQAIQAELEETRLRQQHCQLAEAAQTQRTQALSQAAVALSPALSELVDRMFPRRPAATDLADEDLVAELERRIEKRDWKHGNPFAPLDDLLERMWSQGVEVPPLAIATPILAPSPADRSRTLNQPHREDQDHDHRRIPSLCRPLAQGGARNGAHHQLGQDRRQRLPPARR